MTAPAPEVSSDTNNLLRLQLIARRLPPDDADALWLWNAVRSVLIEGVRLDDALGVTGAGWASPRQMVRHHRRDDLLCQFYRACYVGVSLRAAAATMVAEHARLLAAWGRMRPRLDLISHAPTAAREFHELIAAEGHQMPGVTQLRSLLRRAVIRPVADLDPVETGHPPAAASADDA